MKSIFGALAVFASFIVASSAEQTTIWTSPDNENFTIKVDEASANQDQGGVRP